MFPTRTDLAWSMRRAFGLAIEFATLGELTYEPGDSHVASRPEAARSPQARLLPGPEDQRGRSAGEVGWNMPVAEAAAEPTPRPAPPALLRPATAAARRLQEASGPRGPAPLLARSFCAHAGRSSAAARLARSRTPARRRRIGQPEPGPQPCLWRGQ